MTPRAATTGMFIANGAVVGCWVAQIPFLQDRFDLSNAALGLVILAFALGAITATLAAGQAIARAGSARVVRAAGPAACALLAVPLLAPHPVLTALALVALGAASGAMDVSMNAQGVALEGESDRPLMSGLHAGWSVGGLIGSAAVAGATVAGIEPRLQLAVAAAGLVLAALLAGRHVGAGSPGAGTDAPALVLPSRAVALLAILCLCVMVMEGAMADWSGVYLRRELGAPPGLAALGFAALSAGMLLGRLLGDAANQRLGAVRLLRDGAVVAGVALAGFLAVGVPALTLLGVALVGLGVANGVPLLFSAAGRTGETESGPAVAAVSSLGSLGFLAAPPAIGLIADTVGLTAALAGLTLGMLAVAVFAGAAE